MQTGFQADFAGLFDGASMELRWSRDPFKISAWRLVGRLSAEQLSAQPERFKLETD